MIFQAKRKLLLLSLILILAGLGVTFVAQVVAASEQASSWATPQTMAIKKVSGTSGAQSNPNYVSNLDCTLLTYRVVSSNDMQTGCFTETAFGLLDNDSSAAIFAGTDEAVPLIPYAHQGGLITWPNAGVLLAFHADPIDGVRLSLYKNPYAHLSEHRNLIGQLLAKELDAPADLTLTDETGQQLVVNLRTIAFSSSGSWLVVETLNGYFARINLATLSVTKFAHSFVRPGIPGLLDSKVAVSNDGKFVSISNENDDSLTVYDVTSCQAQPNPNLPYKQCKSHDYRPFIKQNIPSLQRIDHTRFLNDDLLSFQATSASSKASGTYLVSPLGSITNLTDYIGLGDSYTAGEGAFDYLAGTDTGTNNCHLSSKSYPLLLTHDLFNNIGGHSIACSGARITDVTNKSLLYRGQMIGGFSLQQLEQSEPALLASVQANYLPGYLAQHSFVQQYQPKVITVSVGGNDVGFGDMLLNCVEPHVSRHVTNDTCYNTYENRIELSRLIDKQRLKWTALYRQLEAESPTTTVYAVGYPEIVADTGNCALNVQLNKSELEFAEETINYLNDAIQSAATTAGVPYVDIEQALAGHRLCETKSYNVAVNGLTAGKDNGLFGINIFGRESYHPNALGQELIEQAILRQTDDLRATKLPATHKLLSGFTDKPKSGRKIVERQPGNQIVANDVANKGQPLQVSIKGQDYGLKPGTTYQIRLDGPDKPVVTTVTSDSNGDINTPVTVPPGTDPGGHTIDVTGPNQDDGDTDVTAPVYIGNQPGDADGDGIPDATDSCPTAINSGQDSDHDGIDDVCDPIIGTPPNDSSSPPAQTNPTLPATNSPSTPPTQPPINNQVPALVADNPQLMSTPLIVTSFATNTTPLASKPLKITSSALHTFPKSSGLGNKTAMPLDPLLQQLIKPNKAQAAQLPKLGLPIVHWLLFIVIGALCLYAGAKASRLL